jgi:hypothetical protein
MIGLRIPADLYARIEADLDRPHAFASERVGFLLTRPDECNAPISIILALDYWPVPDNDYVKDYSVGARIGSQAIRSAMQKSLDGNSGAIHVHKHHCYGKPNYSDDDWDGWNRLLPSFRTFLPKLSHGVLVLSLGSAAGLIWRDGRKKPLALDKISIVGFPIRIFNHEK